MKKLKIGVMDGIVLLVSVLFLLGTLFVFTPCGPKEDGSWMICHHAGTAVTGIAAVLVLLAVLHLLMPSAKTKLGLAMASLPVHDAEYALPYGDGARGDGIGDCAGGGLCGGYFCAIQTR